MTAAPAGDTGAVPASRWRRHGLQASAVAVIALLVWLFYYLEYLPVARSLGDDDAAQMRLAVNRPVALIGASEGKAMSFRLVGARRLDLTLPDGAEMRSPELAPFLAKADRERNALAGVSCGDNQAVIKALPEKYETVSVTATLIDAGQRPEPQRALLLQRADPALFDGGLRISAHGARLRLTIEFIRSVPTPQVGSMLLCRSGRAATLGFAEFEMPADQSAIAQLRDMPPADQALPAAAFDFYSPQGTGLAVAAVASGPPGRDGLPLPERIACAAGPRVWLWRHLLPGVAATDCAPGGLVVSGLDLTSGQFAIAGKSAFFGGVGDRDTAHFVSKAKENVVVQLLLTALIGGTIIPWALAHFKRRQAESPPRPRPARRKPRSRRKQ